MQIDNFMTSFGLKKKDRFSIQTEKITASRAREFNTSNSENGKKQNTHSEGTGISFDDVAGIDYIIREIADVLSMMKGDPRWKEMGVRVPRGILLSGPPGTGKTLLAKAIAGETKVPFPTHPIVPPYLGSRLREWTKAVDLPLM